MPHSQLDHLVVTAFSLDAGAALVKQALGVSPQAGGAHPRFATHNLLLRIGESAFLEVLAPDPARLAPARPRWFGLDRVTVSSPPCLSAWVVRTTDLGARAAGSTEPLGNIESMSRDALHWSMTIPSDGTVPLDGVAPALIEWPPGVHPTANLEDNGLSLVRLDVLHSDPDRVERLLRSLNLEAPISVEPVGRDVSPRLVAHIATPRGRRALCAAVRLPAHDADW